MVEKIFIGVDGGGTKCKVHVEDESGKLLGQARGGPASVNISVDGAWNSILEAINEALRSTGISLNDRNYNFYAGLALAGTENQQASKEFLSHSHPFTKIVLDSDGYAACLGAHAGKDGAIIIIGTGVVGWRVQGDEVIKVSGWGFPQDDEGGGAWLGLQAIRLTFQAYDGRVEFSPLLHAIINKFDDDFTQLIVWVNKARSTQFAEIAPLVVHYVDENDPWALHLIKLGASKIDVVAETMEKRAKNREVKVPYSLFGGIVPFIQPWLSNELQARLVPRQEDATVGAVRMLKKALEM